MGFSNMSGHRQRVSLANRGRAGINKIPREVCQERETSSFHETLGACLITIMVCAEVKCRETARGCTVTTCRLDLCCSQFETEVCEYPQSSSRCHNHFLGVALLLHECAQAPSRFSTTIEREEKEKVSCSRIMVSDRSAGPRC